MIVYRDILLKIFLTPDSVSTPDMYIGMDWNDFCRTAALNVVLTRAYDRIRTVTEVPESYDKLAVEERARVNLALKAMSNISAICEESKIRFIFTKALQHYPDMGHDIDLLVLAGKESDGIIGSRTPIRPSVKSLFNITAGKTSYTLDDYDNMPLEIHHGRMGHLGEHKHYPVAVIANKKSEHVSGSYISTPSREDRLIICVIQRMYGHLYLRVSDILAIVSIAADKNLDWDYVKKTSRRMGIYAGLKRMLCHVSSIYKNFAGEELKLPHELSGKSRILKTQARSNEIYTLSFRRDVAMVYCSKTIHDIWTLNVYSLFKLALLPLLTLNVLLRGLIKKMRSILNGF